MPLPTIEVPKYKLKVPSTGKMITYRPFLVKDEKVLLTTLETTEEGNEEALTEALLELVNKCIETKNVAVSEFTSFDLEYIFLQLRAKSVGEIAEINIKCQNIDCGIEFPWGVDLSKLEIKRNEKHTKKIQLSDDLGITMRYPSLTEATVLNKSGKTDELFALISSCIDSIYTKEEVFSYKDHSTEELENFIGQLSPEFFKKIIDFFYTMPSMENEIKCSCPRCKEETTLMVRGIEDFFV